MTLWETVLPSAAGTLPVRKTAAVRLPGPPGRDQKRSLSPHEFYPNWVIYGPVVLQWILLGLWHRDFALPAAANPHIESGGLCGESKTGILDQVQGAGQDWIAPYDSFVTGDADGAQAQAIMARRGFTFPIVLKPDVGCKGAGVKLIADDAALREVLSLYPRNIRVILQEYIRHENEAGLFYTRDPGAPRGTLVSLALKASPEIVGDGVSTIRALIHAHPRAGRIPHVYLPRLAERLDEVLAPHQRLPLVFTGNHSKGSVFRDRTSLVTPQLLDRLEGILKTMPEFHHGRVDVRFRDVESLREGREFRIIEINGVGSEPIHMWDPDYGLWDLYRIQMRFYARIFRVGRLMRGRGWRSCSIFTILALWRRQVRLVACYPRSD